MNESRQRKIRLFLTQLRDDSSIWWNISQKDRTGLWSDSGSFNLRGEPEINLKSSANHPWPLWCLTVIYHFTSLRQFVFFGWILKCWESTINGPSKEANCLPGLIHIQQSWVASPDWIDHLLPPANHFTLGPEVTCKGAAWYQITAADPWTAEAKADRRTPRVTCQTWKTPDELVCSCYLFSV